MQAVPTAARSAPAQALLGGATPVLIQTIGRITMGVIDDSVETIPTFPRASAAMFRDMPSPTPKKAEAAATPKARHEKRCGLFNTGNGKAASKKKKIPAKPARIAIAVKGSAPAAMAGRAQSPPKA